MCVCLPTAYRNKALCSFLWRWAAALIRQTCVSQILLAAAVGHLLCLHRVKMQQKLGLLNNYIVNGQIRSVALIITIIMWYSYARRWKSVCNLFLTVIYEWKPDSALSLGFYWMWSSSKTKLCLTQSKWIRNQSAALLGVCVRMIWWCLNCLCVEKSSVHSEVMKPNAYIYVVNK